MSAAQEPQPRKLPPLGNPSIGQNPQNVVQSASPAQPDAMVERRPGQPQIQEGITPFPTEMPADMAAHYPETERSRMQKIFSKIGATGSWMKETAPRLVFHTGKQLVLEMPKGIIKGAAQLVRHPGETTANIKDAISQGFQEKKYMLGGGVAGAASTGLVFTFLASEAPVLAAGLYIKSGVTRAAAEVARERAKKGLIESVKTASSEAEQQEALVKYQKAENRIRSALVGSAVGSVSAGLGFVGGGAILKEGTSVSGVYHATENKVTSAYDTVKSTGEHVWSGIKQAPDVAKDLPGDVKDAAKNANDYLFKDEPDKTVTLKNPAPFGPDKFTRTIPGEKGALTQAADYIKDLAPGGDKPDLHLPSNEETEDWIGEHAVPDNPIRDTKRALDAITPDGLESAVKPTDNTIDRIQSAVTPNSATIDKLSPEFAEDAAREAYRDAFGHPEQTKVDYNVLSGKTTITKIPETSGWVDRTVDAIKPDNLGDKIKELGPTDNTIDRIKSAVTPSDNTIQEIKDAPGNLRDRIFGDDNGTDVKTEGTENPTQESNTNLVEISQNPQDASGAESTGAGTVGKVETGNTSLSDSGLDAGNNDTASSQATGEEAAETKSDGIFDKTVSRVDEAVEKAIPESVKNISEDAKNTVSDNPVAAAAIAAGTLTAGYQVARANNPTKPSIIGRLFRRNK